MAEPPRPRPGGGAMHSVTRGKEDAYPCAKFTDRALTGSPAVCAAQLGG